MFAKRDKYTRIRSPLGLRTSEKPRIRGQGKREVSTRIAKSYTVIGVMHQNSEAYRRGTRAASHPLVKTLRNCFSQKINGSQLANSRFCGSLVRFEAVKRPKTLSPHPTRGSWDFLVGKIWICSSLVIFPPCARVQTVATGAFVDQFRLESYNFLMILISDTAVQQWTGPHNNT